MNEAEPAAVVRRTCRWCGRTFVARKGEAKRRGCPECEPALVPRELTVAPGSRSGSATPKDAA